MRAALRVAALLGLALPAALAAQRPSVSPVLPRRWTRDTVLAVWLFARPAVSLDAAAAAVAAQGGRVRVRSRWLHAVSADVPSAGLQALANNPAFRHIQPVARWHRRPQPPGPAPGAVATAPDTCTPGGDPMLGPSEMPYRQLHLRPLSDAGFDGTGVRVAILDAGFNTLDPAFAGATVQAQYDFVFGDSVVRNDANDDPTLDPQFHGTAMWSLFAANVPGRLRGIAPAATYLLAKTEDVRKEVHQEEDNYVAALEWADSIGVDIVSSSLGYLSFDDGSGYTPSQLNGDVAVTSVAADLAARQGILVVTAAGNGGPAFRTLVTPGDADSVITVGAEDSLGTIAVFSSRGPTADGRLKPDLTAPGVAVCVVAGGGRVLRFTGTSFATPIVAAAAALVKQLHPGLAPMPMLAALRRFATNHTQPDSARGWGRPDVAQSAVFPTGLTALAPVASPLTSITPTFAWSADSVPAFAAPVQYRLRIARDSGLSAIVVDTTLTDVTTYDLRRPLKPGAPLYWRVYATAVGGATATTARIGPLTVPAWATLTALADSAGSATSDPQPTFTWTSPAVASPPGPFTYDLRITRAAAGTADFIAAGMPTTTYPLPQPLERNVVYTWSLVVHAQGDSSLVQSPGTFIVLDASLPGATVLYQNFPNPFPAAGKRETCFWFDLAQPALVQLEILDLRGNPVRRYIPGPDFTTLLPAGRYGRGPAGGPECDPRLTWDGRAQDGHFVPAGVYLFKLKAAGVILFKRVVFLGT